MTPFIGEVFQAATEIDKEKERAEYLRSQFYNTINILRDIIREVYVEDKWDLPEGETPVEPKDVQLSSIMYSEVKKFYLYRMPELKTNRKEMLYVMSLENLPLCDRTLMDMIKDKNLHPRLSKKFFKKYFPEFEI